MLLLEFDATADTLSGICRELECLLQQVAIAICCIILAHFQENGMSPAVSNLS